MKKTNFIGIGLAVALGAVMNCVFAQVMHEQPVSSILKKLTEQGYIALIRVELLNDEYQIHALDNEGEPVDIRLNSHTGEMISMIKTDSHMTMPEVVEKLEAVGYSGITLIEAKNNHYNVVAIAPNGKKTKLRVDAATGKLTKEFL